MHTLQSAQPPARTDLSGKVALVTGGAGGIGLAICRELIRAGAAVAAGYHSSAEAAEVAAERFARLGADFSLHRADVSRAEDCYRLTAETLERHGRVDILVNNAGMTRPAMATDVPDKDWDQILATNLSGPFYLAKRLLPGMIERGSGRIVNLSSVVGQTGTIGQAPYASAKAGLIGLTTCLARDAAVLAAKAGTLSDTGPAVTVNAVAPGMIDTPMTDTIPPRIRTRLLAGIPLGRDGAPHEVARVVVFLCQDASSYITGQVWSVNGGMHM
ncbi:3-oxoacyl-ACP reductase family protein [Streptomyces sp. NPDC003077]|uniref:3-oxoacyl-ACP reductase family protein n=1 Tax=Streptomyces sp. NPDC003077 TaxID=3154443 RepID=UPI0033AD4756